MTETRNRQIARVLRLIQLFMGNRSGFTLKELVQKLNSEGHNCGERTVYRDIEAIETVHFPLVKDGFIYKLKEDAKLSVNVGFSYPELLALFMARRTFETLGESPLQEPLKSLFNKIETLCGRGIADLAEDLNQFMEFHNSPQWGTSIPGEIINTIEKGCAEGQALRLEYRSPSNEPGWGYVDLKVGPEYILFTHNGAYLYAKRLDTQDFKLFAFPRIRTAILLEETYDPVFQGENKVHANSFGVLTTGEISSVQLDIEEPLASYVAERKWHTSQQVVRTEKGITLHLKVRINDELARWVLGLGPSATVIYPIELKSRVCELADAIRLKA